MSETLKYAHACGYKSRNRADMWTHLENCPITTAGYELPKERFTMSAEKEAPYCLICKQNIFCRCPNSIKSDNPYVQQFVLAYREKLIEVVEKRAGWRVAAGFGIESDREGELVFRKSVIGIINEVGI
jgi:hypothetical protein